MEDVCAIVIDNGSAVIKADFAGEDAPRALFPAAVGHLRQGISLPDSRRKEQYIGSDAIANKDILSIRYPIERGIITNWDDMEKIWHYVFYNELHAVPKEHPVLLTEVPLNPIGNREKMAQILFEQFHIPCKYLSLFLDKQ